MIYAILFYTLLSINIIQQLIQILGNLKKNKKLVSFHNPVLYIIINIDLKMSKGKILAQVCHVISSIHYKLQENELKSWKNKGEAKIVLKAPFQTIKTILDKVETYNSNSDQNSNLKITRIHDAGRTQVPAGSLTVIAIGPCEKKIASQFVCDLKMY